MDIGCVTVGTATHEKGAQQTLQYANEMLEKKTKKLEEDAK